MARELLGIRSSGIQPRVISPALSASAKVWYKYSRRSPPQPRRTAVRLRQSAAKWKCARPGFIFRLPFREVLTTDAACKSGLTGTAEGLVVLRKPGNAGGGKGP